MKVVGVKYDALAFLLSTGALLMICNPVLTRARCACGAFLVTLVTIGRLDGPASPRTQR